MIACKNCGKPAARAIGYCYDCVRKGHLETAMETHRRWRSKLRLPPEPPRQGLKCSTCVNECRIPRGFTGYCGVWRNVGHLKADFKVYAYLDPLPTNCVSTPVCPAATRRGFPFFTDTEGPEYGYYNLAVFAYGCTLDCLYCQNWEHKTDLFKVKEANYQELLGMALDPRVRCICYFGGDPTPQAPHFIRLSREVLNKTTSIKRICWETNGLANPNIMRLMAQLSLESGGIVKIDWKAWNPNVYKALTGIDGEKALKRLKENAKMIVEMGRDRSDPPLLVVSLLLVPLYITLEEVRGVAEFVASLGNVPLVLLAFHPSWLMSDLPTTSRKHAEEAVKVAREAGVKEVYLENVHLLSDAEYPF